MVYNDNRVTIPSILIDTGSAGTVIEGDWLRDYGIFDPDPGARILTITGIGGSEYVLEKYVDLEIDGATLKDFAVQIGSLQYGYGINGILGLDALLATRAQLDFGTLSLIFDPA